MRVAFHDELCAHGVLFCGTNAFCNNLHFFLAENCKMRNEKKGEQIY